MAGSVFAACVDAGQFVPVVARNVEPCGDVRVLALTFGEDRVRTAVVTDPDAPLAERRWTWRAP
jgi:hypothetical protein